MGQMLGFIASHLKKMLETMLLIDWCQFQIDSIILAIFKILIFRQVQKDFCESFKKKKSKNLKFRVSIDNGSIPIYLRWKRCLKSEIRYFYDILIEESLMRKGTKNGGNNQY